MALTPSSMSPLGEKSPDFKLMDPGAEQWYCRDDLCRENGLLVIFMCNHCPYVVHIEQALVALGRDYADKAIGIVGISANDATHYPEDAPEHMAEKNYPFPYLYDETQEVAKAFDAACTPDFFLYNANLELVYRGQFDGSRPGNGVEVTGADLRSAMDALLSGQSIDAQQKPSVGCNIKWKG